MITSELKQNISGFDSTGDILTKDYQLLSNWTSDIDDNRAVANHEYILIITDADF